MADIVSTGDEQEEGVLARIRYRPSGYSPIEGRIAGAILENPDAFARISITEFARANAVSTGSVVRFAQSLGFRGFRELKIAVARDGGGGAGSIRTGGQFSTSVEHNMDAQVRAVLFAARDVDSLSIARAADRVIHADHVEVVATGASASIAHSTVFSLMVLGIRARLLLDSGEHAAAAATLKADDLLLAISLSGRTRSTVNAARHAHEAGVQVVVLTANPRSPLARLADVAVMFDGQAIDQSNEWPARTALYAVARCLVLEVAATLPAAEVRSRRGQWNSARFDMRYANR